MSNSYCGQVQAFAFSFEVRGFRKCEGQSVSISSNTALFSLLFNTYGGDGRTMFCLPDLRDIGGERGLSYQVMAESRYYPNRSDPAYGRDTYVGVIETYASTWVPGGTAPCEGQLVDAREHESLWSLLKNRYGGDGTTNLGIPDLRVAASEDNLRYGISLQGIYPSADNSGGYRGMDDGAYIGQVKAFGCDFAPRDWMPCAGLSLGCDENQALFSLIGNRYGGTENATFQLPDLRPLSDKHGVLYCICVRGLYPSRA